MRRRILDYFRYELPENLFDKILLFFLGLFFIVSLITAVMVGNGIRNQEKAIIQLRHEIDSICSCIGKEIPAGGIRLVSLRNMEKIFGGRTICSLGYRLYNHRWPKKMPKAHTKNECIKQEKFFVEIQNSF